MRAGREAAWLAGLCVACAKIAGIDAPVDRPSDGGGAGGAGAVVTLTTPGYFGAALRGIALDATNVYFASDTQVYSVPIAGGSTTELTKGIEIPISLAVDSDRTHPTAANVYFTDQRYCALGAVPISGGSGRCLVDGPRAGGPSGIALGGGNVYWTEGGTPANHFADGSVMWVGEGGGSATTLVSKQALPAGIAADAHYVYWVTTNGGTVMKARSADGTTTTLASGQNTPVAIAIDDANAYWTNRDDGTVVQVPLTGGPMTTVAAGQDTPEGVAVDPSFVYFTTARAVVRAPIGGGASTTLASGRYRPGSIAVDATSVYWAEDAILTVPLP